jgi:hypothetical protein
MRTGGLGEGASTSVRAEVGNVANRDGSRTVTEETVQITAQGIFYTRRVQAEGGGQITMNPIPVLPQIFPSQPPIEQQRNAFLQRRVEELEAQVELMHRQSYANSPREVSLSPRQPAASIVIHTPHIAIGVAAEEADVEVEGSSAYMKIKEKKDKETETNSIGWVLNTIYKIATALWSK